MYWIFISTYQSPPLDLELQRLMIKIHERKAQRIHAHLVCGCSKWDRKAKAEKGDQFNGERELLIARPCEGKMLNHWSEEKLSRMDKLHDSDHVRPVLMRWS
jgi:hypothetical protein